MKPKIVWLMLVGLAGLASGEKSLDELINDVFKPNSTPQVNPGSNPQYTTPLPLPPPTPDPRFPGIGEVDETLGLGGNECECVPYYLCKNGSIITNGEGLLDIRRPAGSPCPASLDVCCNTGDKIEPDEEPVTPKPKGRTGCGMRNVDGVGIRITGNVDNEAQFGEFPWMVAVLRVEDVNGEKISVYKCGGALIHQHVVMTAAHCVVGTDPHSLKARAGEWDTQTSNERLPYQDRWVRQVVVHEGYYAGGLYNDIALLIMDEPFVFADNIDVVCLPRQDDIILHNSCWASGWGKDVFGKQGQYQVILKRVELPMVPPGPCQDSLRMTRLGSRFKLHDSFVCAGGIPGKDTCKGDGGSPLICPIQGKSYQYQQVGIVAWGIGCGGQTPAAYVNVAKFRNWIDHHMQKLGFDPEYNY